MSTGQPQPAELPTRVRGPDLDWAGIDDVLLDMDGTLLDLRYDNDFWLEHLPHRFAAQRGISRDAAQIFIQRLVRSTTHTIQFYCLDHWSERLGLDVAAANEELAHLIAIRPGVTEFLDALYMAGKRRVLVTNSHPRGLAFKLARTGLDRYLDVIISSHETGLPKEHPGFWTELRRRIAFAPQRSVLIDDNPAVLNAARDYGVRETLAIHKPDSRRPGLPDHGFAQIHHFAQLLPVQA